MSDSNWKCQRLEVGLLLDAASCFQDDKLLNRHYTLQEKQNPSGPLLASDPLEETQYVLITCEIP